MRTTRTYYEILGLPRSATLIQIKRRYKELVRKYHPDVAADKAMAHRLFLQIREAYETLSDPVRRREYDGVLDAQSARASAATQRPKAGSAAQHLKDAQWAFIQKRFGEAADHCKEVLRTNPHSARAYSVLGDIYRAQNRINSAIKAYSYAVQFDPTDRESQKKLDRLLNAKIPATKPGSSGPPAAASRMTMFAIWWSVVTLLIFMIPVYPGKPMPWIVEHVPYVSTWSLNMVGLMAAASFVVGMLLCIGGMLRQPDEELVYENSGGNWALVPTGLILLIGSGFFFIGAAVFYIVVGLLQGSLSKSVLTVFGGVAGIVLLTAVVYFPEAQHQVLMFGGNVSFFAMLFGWYFGSMFRPISDM